MASINSPFRYAGGKFFARKLISEHLIDTDMYCEPFAGGASVFFHKEKSGKNVLNDLNETLMLVYRTIRDNPEGLIDALREFKEPSKENHTYYKHQYKPKDDLSLAARWYYLNRTSFSGIMRFDSMYFGYNTKKSITPDKWPQIIETSSEKLQGVELSCKSAIEVIDGLPDGSLAFVDPPYFNATQNHFYSVDFNRQDHIDLAECVRRNSDRLRFFITYDNCEGVRSLYDFMPYMYDKEWCYCLSQVRNSGKELFILNYRR